MWVYVDAAAGAAVDLQWVQQRVSNGGSSMLASGTIVVRVPQDMQRGLQQDNQWEQQDNQ